jgi:predicted metal-dependent peptidase
MAQTKTTENKKSKIAKLIGPTDPKIDHIAREKLITGRIGLLIKQPFFGNLATRLKLENADEWCSTAATDGRKFYYNSRFIDMLKPREVEFLFGHEVLHCCYDHMGRRGDRDPQLFNVANDYCVNSDLKKYNVGEMIKTVPALYDPRFDGMSSEEVYDILFEEADKIDIDDLLDQLLDDHLDGNEEEPEPGSGNSDSKDKDKEKEGKGRPNISEEEKQKIKDELKEAMLQAAQAAGAGNIPSGVQRIINDITNPKMNWRELLRMQLQSTIKSDYSWLRPSRRGWDMDAVMPGMKATEAVDIAIAVDTSGSISPEMLQDFLSEVQGIMDAFDSYKIHIFCFDTEVYNPQDYDSDNLDSIIDYEPKGGGGTNFTVAWDYMKQEGIEPKKLIFFTDGEPFGSWGDPNYCDTIFIVHGNPKVTAPFGVTTHYDDKAAT